jgi:transmembrane sensor
VVADPAIADLKVGGSFRVGDYDAFVRLLEASFGVTAERLENETVLRGRR